MSDIFKKIRSIEAQDDAVVEAMGLKPKSASEGPEGNSEASKPLNLSIPDSDDDILELNELSLEEIPEWEDNGSEAGKSRSRLPLGLTPLAAPVPASKPAPIETPALRPIGSEFPATPEAPRPSAAQTQAGIKPRAKGSLFSPREESVPDFMKTELEAVPEPENIAPQRPATPSISAAAAASEISEDSMPSLKHITIAGLAAGAIWFICASLFGSGLLTGTAAKMSALQMLSLALLVIFPLMLIALATYAFRQLSKITQQSLNLKTTADAMMTPDESVIARSTIMAKSIQAQVDDVNLKVSSALNRMELLDDMVKSQGSSLSKSALAIETTTSDIENRISTQTDGLERVAGLFEGRMSTLSTMLEGHTSHLSSSGQMAEQRVQEARVSVESAAEKIATASETVRQNAVTAAQTLTGSHAEITKLGDDVQAQSTRLDAVYRQHLRDLQAMLADLRDQQDELGATMEERLSKMRDMSISAKVGAESLTEASVKGRETVEALNEAAHLTDTAVRARFSEMEEMVKYSTARAESISETAARQVQNSLSSTRKEISRIEADMMDLMDKMSRAETKRETLDSARFNTAPQNTPSLRGPSKPDGLPRPTEDTQLPSMEFREIEDETNSSTTGQSLFTLGRKFSDESPPRPELAPSASNEMTLDIQEPDIEDLPNPMRRPIADLDEKDKSRWNWKGLFPTPGGTDSPSLAPVSDADIINNLSRLGLTPAAIVDDGCIIEAANLRKVRGSSAMSEAVAKRLSEPVRHLFKAAEGDPSLKTDMRAFTEQFDARLAPVENDREAIRTKLESDAGRAYLLCDAALNA